MSRRQSSIPARYFDDLYAGERDPWEFETSAYEQAKYDATLAALPRPRYRRGLEIGCSIGVLTARLAGRCTGLLAIDVSEKALDAARMRCRTLPNVAFENTSVPAEWPAGTFDLIMLSEVVYYLDAGDVSRLPRLRWRGRYDPDAMRGPRGTGG
jgi:trans-aconitate methyltransferase